MSERKQPIFQRVSLPSSSLVRLKCRSASNLLPKRVSHPTSSLPVECRNASKLSSSELASQVQVYVRLKCWSASNLLPKRVRHPTSSLPVECRNASNLSSSELASNFESLNVGARATFSRGESVILFQVFLMPVEQISKPILPAESEHHTRLLAS